MTEHMTLKRVTDVAEGNYIQKKSSGQKFKVLSRDLDNKTIRVESVSGLGSSTRVLEHFTDVYNIVG
jgi:hypothetical protein